MMTKSAVSYFVATLLGVALTGLAGLDSAMAAKDGNDAYLLRVLDRTADIPDPPAGKIALRLSLRYDPEPLPGDGLQFYESDEVVNSLWAMESLEKGEDVPVGQRLEGNVLYLEPGELRFVTVSYRNPTSEEVGFVTLPHQDSPSRLAQHVKLTCFCLSFVAKAPAEGAWYRVLRMGVGPDIPAGSKLDALFTILTDPATFAPAK